MNAPDDIDAMNRLPGCECYELSNEHAFFEGYLPSALALDASRFDQFWEMHPATITKSGCMGGRSARSAGSRLSASSTGGWQKTYRAGK